MPFTFSHPAIILPLTFLPRCWFSLTGLIVGSLTPDFEYFLRMRMQSDYSHTISGLAWFDLPLGLLLAFIFHNIVRNALFDNLPQGIQSRLLIFKQFNWNSYFKKNWLTVIISIVIGAVSHLFWDSFTHDHGHFVEKFSALSQTVEFFGKPIPVLKILQHSSTLIGGLIIAIVLFRLPKNEIVSSHSKWQYWSIFASLTLIIIALRFLSGLNFKLYGHFIVTCISAGLIALTLTSLLIRKN
ncbi:MAG: DUF4184 family protein [Chitinophagaceae bacterium]|nr:DUF4184 family protein [Chitinophagaceae bacterium]